jgi:hypothetical protein
MQECACSTSASHTGPRKLARWPTRMIDHRPNRAEVIQSADVFVDAGGLIYSTDYNGGLYILEFNG